MDEDPTRASTRHSGLRPLRLAEYFIDWRKATAYSFEGRAWLICPWHPEATPSLLVTGELFWCAGPCGAQGDLLDAIARSEKLGSRAEAERWLAAQGYTPA